MSRTVVAAAVVVLVVVVVVGVVVLAVLLVSHLVLFSITITPTVKRKIATTYGTTLVART